MNDNTILVSLTSHPPRINTAIYTLSCLYEAACNTNHDTKIVFVLSEEEFPYGINSLPNIYINFLKWHSDKIELLIDKGNIRAHKKLIPTIEKYPYNDIICVDDDKLYGKDIINNFLITHKKYPNDVIVGRSHFRIIPINGKFISIKMADFSKIWETPYDILYNCKQASGLSGTLYPAGTFTNSNFFDRKLIMELCEHSDEDWQFMFNVIEDKTLRFNSKVGEYPDNHGFTSAALCNSYGQPYYEQYYEKFNKKFPIFYDKLEYLNNQFEKNYPKIKYNLNDIMR